MTLEHQVSQLIGMGKGDGHADNDFSLVMKVKCAKFYQDLCKISSGSECRATPDTPTSTFLNFFNFQNQCEHVYNNL